MFLRHSMVLRGSCNNKRGWGLCYANGIGFPASFVSGLEIRVWWHHILESDSVYSASSCGTLALVQRPESEICSAYFSCPGFSRRQAYVTPNRYLFSWLPVLLVPPISYGTLGRVWLVSYGQQTREEVKWGGKEVRADCKYISMFISVRRFSSGGHTGQREPGLIAHKENDRKQKKNLMWDWQWKGRSTGWWEERRGHTTEVVKTSQNLSEKGLKCSYICYNLFYLCPIILMCLWIQSNPSVFYEVAFTQYTNAK